MKMLFFLIVRMRTWVMPTYIIFIMCNSISGLDAWYYFWFNISCGVAVTVRSHQQIFQVNF